MTDTSLAGWTPRQLPTSEPLGGDRVIVLSTDVARDAAGLFEATCLGDPVLWDYLPYGPFGDEGTFEQWLAMHVSDPELWVMTVLNRESGAPVGSATYMRMDPAHGVIEIGHIFFGATLQRTPAATEALYLMLRHLFDELGYRRVEWKCDAANARIRAAERLGFVPEGVFRQHRIVKGRNRDTAWFSIIDREWPGVWSALEAWLSPENFDADGRQPRPVPANPTGLAGRYRGTVMQDSRHGDRTCRPKCECPTSARAGLSASFRGQVEITATEGFWQRTREHERPACVVRRAFAERAGTAVDCPRESCLVNSPHPV